MAQQKRPETKPARWQEKKEEAELGKGFRNSINAVMFSLCGRVG